MSSIIPLLTEYEKQHLSERQALPEKYLGLSDEEMRRRIATARATLGTRLVILAWFFPDTSPQDRAAIDEMLATIKIS